MVIWQYVDKDRQCTYKFNTEASSGNHCCRGKAISITYSKCVFEAFVIQDAMRMRRIIFSSVPCPFPLYFSTLFHKRHDFRKKFFNMKYAFWFSPTIFVWNISHSKKKWTRYYLNVNRSSRKVPVRVVRFKAWIFSTDFRKILKYQIISW